MGKVENLNKSGHSALGWLQTTGWRVLTKMFVATELYNCEPNYSVYLLTVIMSTVVTYLHQASPSPGVTNRMRVE